MSTSPDRRRLLATVAGGVAIAVVAVIVGFLLGRSSDDDTVAASDTSTTTAGTDEGGTDDEPDGPGDTDSETGGPDDSGGSDDEVLAPPATIPTEGLEGDALALAEAMNTAAGLEYHARYEGENVTEQGTTSVAVEVWRRLPRARRDTTISGTQELRTSEFRLPDGIIGCVGSPPDVPLSCFEAPSGTVDPSDPVLGAVDPHAGLVIYREGEFEGVRVDCWEVESIDDPTTTLCVDEAGIPLVIDGGDGRLLRTLLDDAIDSSSFELPAEVEPG